MIEQLTQKDDTRGQEQEWMRKSDQEHALAVGKTASNPNPHKEAQPAPRTLAQQLQELQEWHGEPTINSTREGSAPPGGGASEFPPVPPCNTRCASAAATRR
eukprot:13203117-Heterocapsa_arctica.AAC.1